MTDMKENIPTQPRPTYPSPRSVIVDPLLGHMRPRDPEQKFRVELATHSSSPDTQSVGHIDPNPIPDGQRVKS